MHRISDYLIEMGIQTLRENLILRVIIRYSINIYLAKLFKIFACLKIPCV